MEEFIKCLFEIRDSLQSINNALQAQEKLAAVHKEREKAVTVDEIAEMFGCGRECVLQNLRRAGSPGMKTGPEKKAEWRVIPSEYAAYLKKLAVGSKAG